MNLLQLIQKRLTDALKDRVTDPALYAAQIKQVQDPRFGDYQVNCAMPLAKALGRNSAEIAQELAHALDLGGVFEPPLIAGPGFINLRLRDEWIAAQLWRMTTEERFGLAQATPIKTVVIDFSSPNVAKPMHAGHLRSTIIGDALSRLFRFLGHRVITDNHVGDWGTQFGILLYGYKHFRDEAALRVDPVREMTRLYVHVRGLMKEEDEEAEDLGNPVAEEARRETAKLHAGDPENLRLWRTFMPWCLEEIERVYRRLDVNFDHTLGESFYNPMLPDVVGDLQNRCIAQTSDGAVVIFFGPDDPPALIQKKDGAFTYTTTDLATIRYRVEQWNPHLALYVVDARQALHFRQLFDAAQRWGYTSMAVEHVSFGSVLGPDRKPIKTRDGGAVELTALLDKAVEQAARVYEQSRAERIARGEEVPHLTEAERCHLAEVVGLAAVKYADLSQNRTTDYVFNWEKMLAMDGNTAAYMQYAYARLRSILRKGECGPATSHHAPPLLIHPEERTLGVQLLRLGEALQAATEDYRPSSVTAYLWNLARACTSFYQTCPVLKAPTPELRRSRLLLCDLSARVMVKGLDLLGIRTLETM